MIQKEIAEHLLTELFQHVNRAQFNARQRAHELSQEDQENHDWTVLSGVVMELDWAKKRLDQMWYRCVGPIGPDGTAVNPD